MAKATAYQATLQGFDVRYVETVTEFARYAVSSAEEQAALRSIYIEPALLVLDALFLARRIPEAAANCCSPSCTSATSIDAASL